MRRLTARHEGPDGWAVEDAPPDYIEKMVAATVGIEIAVERIEGKWKASQNRNPAERARACCDRAGGAGLAGARLLPYLPAVVPDLVDAICSADFRCCSTTGMCASATALTSGSLIFLASLCSFDSTILWSLVPAFCI